jgi:drug/metabolite transporter (DMT)-like permease
MIAVAQARRRAGAVQVMLWSTLTGLPFLLAGALVLREDFAPETWRGWAACVGLGVMHVAGQGSIAWALGRLPAATASVVVLIQPVVAGALGWLLFAEALGPWQALGGAIALAGIALAQWAGRPKLA